MQQGRHTLRLPRSLYFAPPEPKPVKEEPKKKGKVKIPDEVILQMRKMREVDKMSIADVAKAFPDVSAGYVQQVLLYTVRANVGVKEQLKRGGS